MGIELALKILGIFLLLLGIVLSSNPELVSDKPVPEDIFRAVERRVWWGVFIGAGVLLLFHHQLLPWSATIAAVFACATFGLLVARLIGITLDGSVPMQWFWVMVEAAFVALFVWWYFKLRT